MSSPCFTSEQARPSDKDQPLALMGEGEGLTQVTVERAITDQAESHLRGGSNFRIRGRWEPLLAEIGNN